MRSRTLFARYKDSSLRYPLFALLGLALVFSSCKKEENLIFEVNTVETQPIDYEKGTIKTDQQYLSILYSNLFQKSLPANELFDILDLVWSCGDKETIYEVIISSFMNSPDKIIPTEQEMRADLDQFIEDTYVRFYIRMPSQAEKAWFRNMIASDPDITPELVYMSFALSNEYLYY